MFRAVFRTEELVLNGAEFRLMLLYSSEQLWVWPNLRADQVADSPTLILRPSESDVMVHVHEVPIADPLNVSDVTTYCFRIHFREATGIEEEVDCPIAQRWKSIAG